MGELYSVKCNKNDALTSLATDCVHLLPVGGVSLRALEDPFGGLVVILTPIFPDSFGNNLDKTSAFRFVPEDSFRLASGTESSLLLLLSPASEMSTFSFLNLVFFTEPDD